MINDHSDDDQRRFIAIIEECEAIEQALSYLAEKAYVYRASTRVEAAMAEAQYTLQQHINRAVNDLKAEGYEIEWDGPITVWVKKTGQPYLKRDGFNSGEWETWDYQCQLPLMAEEER